jgi:two-component system chemotaxis response regulator CheB
MKIKVMVVDDSALIRSLLTEVINSQPDMEVIATAPDPLIARELIKQHNPDVLTLDVEMPKMDGLDFLGRLMRLRPMPVVMISTLTKRGSEVTLKALELGAVDVVAKPQLAQSSALLEYSEIIADKIRSAAQSKIKVLSANTEAAQALRPAASQTSPIAGRSLSGNQIVAIGASTGGTVALKSLLLSMPANAPGMVITQHMPAGFTKTFAERLNSVCKIQVIEAVGGEAIAPGYAFVAPGGRHLLVAKSGSKFVTAISDAPAFNRHRPSVDLLFDSVATTAGANAVGVILTGMGKDGAQGLLRMKNAGAYTIAQNEETCVVYGMPKEAVALGAVHTSLALDDIAQAVLERIGKTAT